MGKGQKEELNYLNRWLKPRKLTFKVDKNVVLECSIPVKVKQTEKASHAGRWTVVDMN